MRDLSRHIASLCITLWVGGMWMLGYVVVPALFHLLPDRMLAGRVAGELFTLLAYIGMASALYLLLYQFQKFGRNAITQRLFQITIAMLVLVLVGQFVLQPVMVDLKAQAAPLDVMHSVFAGRFKALHAVSEILFLAQSLLGITLVLNSKKTLSV
jgi:Domain of unknown function (DUF4149)